MNIQNRVTFWFTLVTGLVFLLVMLMIYLVTDTLLSAYASASQMMNLRIMLILTWVFASSSSIS